MENYLKSFLRPVLLYLLIGFVGLTTRKVLVNWDILETLRRQGQPYLLGFWHNNIPLLIYMLRNQRPQAIISRSGDGEDINWVVRAFGWRTGLRGSATSGGMGAFRQALRLLSRGEAVVVTPDGPRGPRYVVQPGISALARKKGVPIVPICYSAPKCWELRSWDRTKIPKPFSKVTVWVDNPIWLQGEPGDGEADRLRVQQAMREMVQRADAFSGATGRYHDPALWGESTEEGSGDASESSSGKSDGGAGES